MEILAHCLEMESSVHRRVDLFFLVDSIAQFSRGLKGDMFIALLHLNLTKREERKCQARQLIINLKIKLHDFAGDVCGVYSSAIQASLPRLLSAAAPPGNTAQENRRQCLKAS